MSEEILATRWFRKGEIEDLVTGLPFAGFLLTGAALNKPVLIVPALGFFLVGFTLQRLRFRRCRCQKCGTLLHRKLRDGASISFYCESCDIVWVTRVIQDGD